jgi:hypothetical protein
VDALLKSGQVTRLGWCATDAHECDDDRIEAPAIAGVETAELRAVRAGNQPGARRRVATLSLDTVRTAG